MSAALSLPGTSEPEWVCPPAAVMQKELDKVKSSVFLNKTAAFFGPLLCSLEFIWSDSIKTAGTDGESLWWSPKYFFSLVAASRKTDLMHELWHVAELDMLRRGTRDHKIWNIACDIRIDLRLENDGYTFEGIEGVLTWPGLNARQYVHLTGPQAGEIWVAEDIYDDLVQKAIKVPPNYVCDIHPGGKQQIAKVINNVVKAMHSAKMAGCSDHIPGALGALVERFLAPIIAWERYLHEFMRELIKEEYSLRRPNRRLMAATGIYMPSIQEDEGLLEHLIYFEDVSGSVDDADCLRFNSEIKYVKDTYRPKKLTLVQFDTSITQVRVFEEDDPFERIQITGRGGTSLVPVRDYIIEHKPTAAIVFSDMICAPMEPLPFNIPIIWVVIRNSGQQVPFGKVIHIR